MTEVKGREHPAQLREAQTAVVLVELEVRVVVPLHERVVEGGKKGEQRQAGHEDRRQRRDRGGRGGLGRLRPAGAALLTLAGDLDADGAGHACADSTASG